MANKLHHLLIDQFIAESGLLLKKIPLSYETFGQPLGTSPVVMINHALTGNSNVADPSNGWWKDLVGPNEVIDTFKFTVICFNIPGNGYDGYIIKNYKKIISRDIARLFILGLEELQILKLYALIGGSLGGGIAWEMAALKPDITEYLIPIAADWKSTDWIIANCQLQEQILKNSSQPVHDARMHAMISYRTPESFQKRFQRTINTDLQIYNVESWLFYHGKKLEERYQLASYHLMNQLLKTIDVTQGGQYPNVISEIEAKITMIGVDSDLLFSPEENKRTQRDMALIHDNITYSEINSIHGHDAFLMEYDQLEKLLYPIFKTNEIKSKMVVVKFGGQSLSNEGINHALEIIEAKVKKHNKLTIVVSARGNTTDELEELLQTASENRSYHPDLKSFFKKQKVLTPNLDFSNEFERLEKLLEGVSLIGSYNDQIKDEVLSFGEIISSQVFAHLLNYRGIPAKSTDTRKLIITDSNFGNAQPILSTSKERVISHFQEHSEVIHVATGFIASTEDGKTSTLGRNGSNYTASLLANFLDVEELQNYTHVDGIFTANPDLVPDAKRIEELSFSEANELANFGTKILHAKTIIPLIEKNINLRILNTYRPDEEGTLITSKSKQKGIKSLSVLEDVALLNFEGRGLLGKIGVDARLFSALSHHQISVSLVSQGSSERGIGLVVHSHKAQEAVKALEREFAGEFYTKDVNKISIIDDIAIISIVGQDLSEFHLPYNALIKNQITPLLFNNSISGKNVSLVVKKRQLHKALNVIHGQIFGVAKKVNLAIIGKGLVGGTLIDQIIENAASILKRRKIHLNIFAIAGTSKILLNKNGISKNWRTEIEDSNLTPSVKTIVQYAEEHHLENLIAIDNTASKEFVKYYIPFIEAGFDLVSSNKIANTNSYEYYQDLRTALEKHNKTYLYETNVGAGLPIIDTINLLHDSGENITRIRGVFSGSLSYLFNYFSSEDSTFSEVLQAAIDKGYTEPDPREDLSGNDVARKLLILARELDLENEFEDIDIENLIPEGFRDISAEEFLNHLGDLDSIFQEKKRNQEANHVLRYIGDLHGDLSQSKGELDVKLVSVPVNSPLGSLKGSDAIFEIYTESYGTQPIVIQGAGAGAKVTARGVFGDILRLAKNGPQS